MGRIFFDRRDDMLNNIGPAGLLLIAVVVLVLFGRGKIAGLMGEVGKGITSFKKGISEGDKQLKDESDDDIADIPQPKVKNKDKV
jgi:sec-independent protein translocase protein TatA